jgi:hypothetical protein
MQAQDVKRIQEVQEELYCRMLVAGIRIAQGELVKSG